MHVRKKGLPPSNYNFVYDGNVLDLVDNYKYLEFVLSSDGNVNERANTLARAGEITFLWHSINTE